MLRHPLGSAHSDRFLPLGLLGSTMDRPSCLGSIGSATSHWHLPPGPLDRPTRIGSFHSAPLGSTTSARPTRISPFDKAQSPGSARERHSLNQPPLSSFLSDRSTKIRPSPPDRLAQPLGPLVLAFLVWSSLLGPFCISVFGDSPSQPSVILAILHLGAPL